MKKILLFSRDPGGANTVIPLCKPLKDAGYEVFLFGKDVALEKYLENGLNDASDIMDCIKDINPAQIQEFVAKFAPDLIVTGTSGDDFCEKYIWKAAKSLQIPSIAILDQWVNYGIRFSKYSVCDLDKYQKDKIFDYLPDRIFLMDGFAKEEAIKEGLPEDSLVVTGQPYFQTIQDRAEKIETKKIAAIRESYGVKKGDMLVTFASENITELYSDPISLVGYSELSILNHLLKSLQGCNNDRDKKVICVVRPHPKEGLEKYKNLKDSKLPNGTILIIDKSHSSQEVILSSDLVCGMSSMFLLESVLLKKPTLSIQIGLKKENPFILDRAGILRSVLTSDELLKSIDFKVNRQYNKGVEFSVIEGPVKNIMSEIKKFV